MQLTFDRVLALIGIVLAILLVVLDKAEKLKGPILFWLLALAALLTLPLVLGNSWIRNTPWGILKFSKGMLMVSLLVAAYSVVAIWISPNVPGNLAPAVAKENPSTVPHPIKQEPRTVVKEPVGLYAQVLAILPGPVYQFYQHPPVYFRRLDTSLYVSITNLTDIPLYLRRYSAAALVNGEWITFKNADPGAYWADQFGTMIPPENPTEIRRFDLSRNGFDYVMNQRPLLAHENLRLWMFFSSGIKVGTKLEHPRCRLTFYDSTNKKYVRTSESQDIVISVGQSGSGADLTALNPEPIPPNLKEEPSVK
jgi:hypothetical protein